MDEGKKILLSSFWCSQGWHKTEITDEVFELCKKQGYMFDPPVVVTHEEFFRQLDDVLKKTDPKDVANAFLYSLSTRELEFRSALGSYWYAVSIPENMKKDDPYLCGWSRWSDFQLKRSSGYNVLNFERYKWGGVRHTDPTYALFDLEQFLLLPKVTPKDEDIRILKEILSCVSEIKPSDKVGALQKTITSKKIFSSNKSEVQILLNILGICGVLSSADHPCYADKFAPCDGSRDPVESKNDYDYPVNRWYARDGINTDRLKIVFGGYDFT
ncbi:hypothetical protein SAMN02910264_01810 [Ruminococcaceae bacterium YAD3003]|nr:hypothetical protein SAMN02910264_01810 [Ruminococcaceae bacterium YAD3003]